MPTRSHTTGARRALLAAGLAAAAVVLPTQAPVTAQGLVNYHCTDPENPFGYEVAVEATAGVAPESMPVGGTAELSSITVGVHFVSNPAAFSDTKATLTAALTPGGAVAFTERDVNAAGVVISDGGSAQVVASGTPGQTMDVALSSFHIAGHYPISGGSYALDCAPTGSPSTLASIRLTDPGTPPGPDVIVQPATPILSNIRYAG